MGVQQITLGPVRGVHRPGYELAIFRDGNPHRPIAAGQLDLRSVTSIDTSKNIGDRAGTFTITLKDHRALSAVREMDVVVIRLRGHRSPNLITVLRGVVDEVDVHQSADPAASQSDVVITGRCLAKYLDVTSLFLPVWSPGAALPTALTFGFGDATNKAGGTDPYHIFRYLVRTYTFGDSQLAGLSGVPAARFWIDYQTRFSRTLGFQVPFLQFDESPVLDALDRLEVLGFTEAWTDELGRVVYRHPGWDQQVRYVCSTQDLIENSLGRSDTDVATYVEVIPSANPGIGSGTAQALLAGRAPVPSSYLANAQGSGSALQYVDRSYVIETDSQGHVTPAGRRNHWHQLQTRLGLRPQQIDSPLLADPKQAQRQAEGLLRFFTRMVKSGQVTLPGFPEVRLGYTIRLHGPVKGEQVDRTYYIEGVAHSYSESQGYTTTLQLTHGRDPTDPKWGQIVLPKFDAARLAQQPGILDPTAPGVGPTVPGGSGSVLGDGTAAAPRAAPARVQDIVAAGNQIIDLPYKWGGGHGGFADTGYDCSGAVSFALHGAGLLDTPLVSGDFGSHFPAGQGKWVSIFYNASHVFMVVAGLRLDTVHTDATEPAGTGPRWQPAQRSTAGFNVCHPKGL